MSSSLDTCVGFWWETLGTNVLEMEFLRVASRLGSKVAKLLLNLHVHKWAGITWQWQSLGGGLSPDILPSVLSFH